MASATVGSTPLPPPSSPPLDRLTLESIPTVDLRLLTQSELTALSLCSSHTFDLRRCDDIVIPKIDRSVFNESAGSRKQTYSRLRLAPRNKPKLTFASPLPEPPPIERAENSRIISLFKNLFNLNNGIQEDEDKDGGEAEVNELSMQLVPVTVEYCDRLSDTVLGPASHEILVIDGNKKRKRGRKGRSEMVSPSTLGGASMNTNISSSSSAIVVALVGEEEELDDEDVDDVEVEDKVVNVLVLDEQEEERKKEERERELVDKNGVMVDLAAIAKMEDPYGDELRRQTEGKGSAEDLLVFVGDLEGEWGSRRKKRKVVDANLFGDALPNGWKLLIAIKKKQGRAWVFVHRYISPNGRYFVSCKDVSSYLVALTGPQESEQQPSAHNAIISVGDNNMISDDADEMETMVDCPASSVTCQRNDLENGKMQLSTTLAIKQEKQFILPRDGSLGEVQVPSGLKCHKCSAPFYDKDELLHHLVSCHKRKRRKSGVPIEDDDLVKDGKYECQFCNKIFLERNSYFGHVGVHVKNYVRSLGGTPGLTAKQKTSEHVLIGDVSMTPSVTPNSADPESKALEGTSDTLVNSELLKESKISATPGTELLLDYGNRDLNGISSCIELNFDATPGTADANVIEGDKICDSSKARPDDCSGSDKILVNEDTGLCRDSQGNSVTKCVVSEVEKPSAVVLETAEPRLCLDNKLADQENNCDSTSMNVMVCERLPSESGLPADNMENSSRDHSSSVKSLGNKLMDQYFHDETEVGDKDGLADGSGGSDFDHGMDAEDDFHDSGNLEECSATRRAEKDSCSATVSRLEHIGSPVSDLNVDRGYYTPSAGQQTTEMQNSEGQDFMGLVNESHVGFCRLGNTAIPIEGHSENSAVFVSRDYSSNYIGKEALGASDVDVMPSAVTGAFQVEQTRSPEDSTRAVSFDEKEEDKSDHVLNTSNLFFSSGRNDNHLDVDDMTDNDQSHTNVSNLLVAFDSFVEDKQEPVPKGMLSGLSMNEGRYEVAMNDEVNVSSTTTAMHFPGFDKVQSSRPNKLVPVFGNMSELNERFMNPVQRNTVPQVSSPFQLWGQQSRSFESSQTNVCGSVRGVAHQEQASDISSLNLVGLQHPSDARYDLNEVCMNKPNYPQHNEAGVFSRNNEVRMEGISDSSTLNLAGFQQQFNTRYNLNKPCMNQQNYSVQHNDVRSYSTQDEARQERVAHGNSLSLASVPRPCDTRYRLNKAGVPQTCETGYSLNKGYVESMQGFSKLDELGNSRDRNLMIGFGSDNGRPNQAASSGFMWRSSEANILSGGLADTSSQGQSSGSFQAFDFLSDKGGNDIYTGNNKFDNMSSFEGLRSNAEPMEFSFMTTQESNTQLEHPKVMQYDADFDQGFGSSLWNQKTAPLSNMMGGHVVSTTCVWCNNEFHQDPLACEMQVGSIGYLCPTCKARVSGQFL